MYLFKRNYRRYFMLIVLSLFLLPSLIYGYSVTANKLGGQTTGVNVLGIASSSSNSSTLGVIVFNPAGGIMNVNNLSNVTTATTLSDVDQTGLWRILAAGRQYSGGSFVEDNYYWVVTQ